MISDGPTMAWSEVNGLAPRINSMRCSFSAALRQLCSRKNFKRWFGWVRFRRAGKTQRIKKS